MHIAFANKNFKPRKEKYYEKQQNLNPLNDPEVAKMLTMSPEDQLWSFLDDCVPYDGKNAVLVMMGDFDIDDENEDGNITINGVPYCAMITDLIFEKMRRRTVINVPDKAIRKVFRNSERVLQTVFYRMLHS